MGNQSFIEGVYFIVVTVGIIDPLNEFKKAFQCLHGKSGRNGLIGMDGNVAERDDAFDFVEQKAGELFFEGVLVDERGEGILIGSLYTFIDGVDPLHG